MLFITCVNNYVFIAAWDYLLAPYYVSFSTHALWDYYYSFLPPWSGAIILGNVIPLAVSTLRNTWIVWALLCYNANVRVTSCSSHFSHLFRLRNPKQKLRLALVSPTALFLTGKASFSPSRNEGRVWRVLLLPCERNIGIGSTTSIAPLHHNYSLNALDPNTVTGKARTIMYELEEKHDSICKTCIWSIIKFGCINKLQMYHL